MKYPCLFVKWHDLYALIEILCKVSFCCPVATLEPNSWAIGVASVHFQVMASKYGWQGAYRSKREVIWSSDEGDMSVTRSSFLQSWGGARRAPLHAVHDARRAPCTVWCTGCPGGSETHSAPRCTPCSLARRAPCTPCIGARRALSPAL